MSKLINLNLFRYSIQINLHEKDNRSTLNIAFRLWM
jgi:hypothetical protein